MRARRELIAYALVREEYERTGDITHGLMPIFSPLLQEQAGKLFAAKALATSVEETYGIPMAPLAAEGIAPKLEKAGILTLENKELGRYRVKKNLPNLPEGNTSSLVELVETFVHFAENELDNLSLSCTAEEIEKHFLNFVKDQSVNNFDFQSGQNFYTKDTLTLNKNSDPEGG